MSFARLILCVLGACGGEARIQTSGPAPGETAAPDSGEPPDSAGDSVSTGESATGDDSGDTGRSPPGPPAPCDAWGEPVETGALVDVELNEVSGVVASTANPGVLWVHEDHGGPTALTALDEGGNTIGAVTLEGVENVDWEALAIAPCDTGDCLWIADIGDNENARTDAALLRVPEPPVVEGLALSVVPEVVPLAFPDGPHNAEAFAILPDGRGLVVTKRFDHTAGVYVVDLERGETFGVADIVTGESEDDAADAVTSADVWPDGSRLLLRTYGATLELDLSGGLGRIAEAPRTILPFSPVVHVEAVAYDAERRGYWQIPEGIGAPIAFVPCLD